MSPLFHFHQIFSAFVVRFVTKRYICEYMRNQHSCYEHEVTFGDGNSHRFEILDLSDCRRIDEKAEKQFEEHIKWGDVFFLMFSITGTQFYSFPVY